MVVLLLLLLPAIAWTHPGALDAHGCHHDPKAGGYHCHRGLLAGQSFASKAEMLRQLEGTGGASAVSKPSAPILVSVVQIIDGDTIRVCCLAGREEKVRYIGVNTPEVHHPTKGEEPGGREATAVNRQLVGGRQVRLELDVQERDRYGRVLAYVYVDKVLVQEELVKLGWAIVTRTQPLPRYRRVLLEKEEEAKTESRGLWAKGEHRGKLVVVEVHPRERGRKNANDEYVVFKNAGVIPLNLTGWTVSDEANQTYLVPQFTLGPGNSFILYTGLGKNSAEALYWGRQKVVWNRTGDTVIVKNDTGHLVLSHRY